MTATTPGPVGFSTIPELLDELRAGRAIVMCDDEDRENEGDLIIAAEHITPEKMAFIIRHTGGVVCLVLTGETCDRLGLHMMVPKNTTPRGTAMTVAIDAAEGVTTGISAADRAHTVLTAIKPDAHPDDLARPGHVFPLRARDGGVLVRTGHTEASIDLCRLAGLGPTAVLSELTNDDGTMMRVPDCQRFSAEHGLKLGLVRELVEYRRRNEALVERFAKVKMPTDHGDFDCYAYESVVDGREHLALVHGFESTGDGEGIDEPVLVRVHSECLTGDVFHSMRCDCGQQLHAALEQISKAPRGVLLYLRGHEGRGIGLLHKLKAYELQEQGYDTVEANEKLGFKADQREYGIGAQILHDLGIRKMRLLTNNPRKFNALRGYDLEITEVVSLQMKPGEFNRDYLETKRTKLGHNLTPADGSSDDE